MIVARKMINQTLPGQREEYRQNREGKGLFTPNKSEKNQRKNNKLQRIVSLSLGVNVTLRNEIPTNNFGSLFSPFIGLNGLWTHMHQNIYLFSNTK